MCVLTARVCEEDHRNETSKQKTTADDGRQFTGTEAVLQARVLVGEADPSVPTWASNSVRNGSETAATIAVMCGTRFRTGWGGLLGNALIESRWSIGLFWEMGFR